MEFTSILITVLAGAATSLVLWLLIRLLSPRAPTAGTSLPQPQPPSVPEKILVSKPSDADSLSPIPLIPRPPVIGFVARRDKDGHDIVELLKEELAPGKNQLLSLWGPGGIGKTTLAAEAARALSESYKQRIVWVSADGRADF